VNDAAESQRRAPADLKKGGTPIVCLTAYTAPIARLLDAHVDLLLVGDSLGMTQYGFENTLPVTLEMMIAHGRAVVQSTRQAVIVVDMPYGTYEKSPDEALRNAKRILGETGCSAVKLEGGQDKAATIRHLCRHGIAVMGHVGLMPQSIKSMGGFKIQGRHEEDVSRIIADTKAVADAGAFAIVIEGTVEAAARRATEAVSVPTIGIGASPACDGQILVINDVLGLTEKPPRFAKAYAALAPIISAAVKNYADEVRARAFPDAAHCYGTK
jgi:3-methyl-2-oxobutanoate hydroxymethyltransferase